MKLTCRQMELLILKTDEMCVMPPFENTDWIDVCKMVYEIRHDVHDLGEFDENLVHDFCSQMDVDNMEIFVGEQLQKSDREV